MTFYCKDYDITEVIHESALTTIFHGIRKSDKTPVVMKLLKPECINDRSSKKIENEFNFLQKIDSPQVIRAYELVPFQKTLILVLEEFTTRTLSQHIREEHRDIKQSLEIAIEIAEGIGRIHMKNIIHKDIKPGNILINAENKIKIIDFGIGTSLARELQQEMKPEQLEGTISYISPEQTARTNRLVDYRTDIYSLGVTLYELFTGKLPFVAETPIELIHLHIAQKPIPPTKVNSDIPDVISDIILKCMEKNPEDRYKSAFGLKKDLERCLALLGSTNLCPRFKLAEKDVYDRFHASKKIYGRENELEVINACFDEIESGKSRLVTITGPAGIGKSCLVPEINKIVTRNKGYFFTVKYDPLNKQIPYYGISTVYKEMIHQILIETDDVVSLWRTKILDGLEGKGQILIDIIPDLKLIIGEQPAVDELPPLESENRFKYLFGKFMKLMVDPDHPLVMLFDNFHWGDESTMKLLTLLLSDETISRVLVIFCYRDNEVGAIHPLTLAINELKESTLKVTSISLQPLGIESINLIIKDIFPGIGEIEELSEAIKKKTFGNPFFIMQCLKYFYGQEIIQFNYSRMSWEASVDKVISLEISENVVELLVNKLRNLNLHVLELLKVCSVIGNRFELQIPVIFFGNHLNETNRYLDIALEEEFITPVVDVNASKDSRTFQFSHDRIRQVIYDLIDKDEKSQIHFQIGHILLETLSEKEIEENMISIINHLNYGINFSLDENILEQMVNLNLQVGLKIKNSQAHPQAIPHFEIVLHLLKDENWSKNYNQLYLSNENLGICYQIIGDIERANIHYNICLNHAETKDEKINIYSKLIFLSQQTKQYDKVTDYAKNALDLLGYPFDMNPSMLYSSLLFIKTMIKLKFINIETIRNSPRTPEKNMSHILKIMTALGHATYITGNQPLWLKLVLNVVNLSLKYGTASQDCGASFLAYAAIMGTEAIGDFDACFKYGQLGRDIMNANPPSPEAFHGLLVYPYFVHRCRYPLRDSIPILISAYRECMIFGNIPVAASCIVCAVAIQITSGERLSTFYVHLMNRVAEFKNIPAVAEYYNILLMKEICLALQGKTSDPLSFCPIEFIDEIDEKQEIKADRLYIFSYRMWYGIMLYLFNRYTEASEEFKELFPSMDKFPGLVEYPLVYLCYALSLGASISSPSDNPKNWRIIKRINRTLAKWRKSCPIRYEVASLYAQGEVARIEGRPIEVIQCFSQAIRKAKTDENFLYIGIGYELFARHYIRLEVTDLAVMFLEKALYFFETYGAVAKCNEIKLYYSKYLASEDIPVNFVNELSGRLEEVTCQTAHSVKTFDSYSTLSSTLSATSGESRFDLNMIMKASETLAKEIEFDKLVQSLMNLMIVNAGANKAFLIIYENNLPYVYSEIFLGEPYIPLPSPVPLEQRKNKICIPVIEYVGRTKKEIVLNNATEKGPFYHDSYIMTKRPKSVLCLPLLQNEDLKGILYLENTATIEAFTQSHLRLLTLLSTQMATSIENAKFYTNLEAKVRARTKELEEKNLELNRALKHIQETQDQLIQKEKLASLGVLTAGIAHELKNPLNFIINFAQIIKDNLNDLKEEIKTGNKEEKLILVNEMIDNLNVIDSHGQRSNSIIKGMLSHSHQGSKTLEEVDINDLVDQAFGLAYYTFRKKEPSFNLKVEKSYGENLPLIKGYSGDLLRVFINIIDNACYALFEKMKLPIEGFHPQFEIKTSREEDFIIIILKDNGPGIPQEYLNKVFNPFFTTKPAGSGTGLGLSIAYDIITKEHSGELKVRSESGELTEFVIKLPIRTGGVS